jgi:hypothetical protein
MRISVVIMYVLVLFHYVSILQILCSYIIISEMQCEITNIKIDANTIIMNISNKQFKTLITSV